MQLGQQPSHIVAITCRGQGVEHIFAAAAAAQCWCTWWRGWDTKQLLLHLPQVRLTHQEEQELLDVNPW